MTEKTYVVVEINEGDKTHRFPCEVVKLNESAKTADIKFSDGIVYNNVPYDLINEGVGDLWDKIKSGAKSVGAKFKKVGSTIVAFVNGVIASALSPLQAAFNFQKGGLAKGIVIIPSDSTIEEAKEAGITLSKNLDKLEENEDVEGEKAFIQSLNDFWTLVKEQHEAREKEVGTVSESDMRAIYWRTLSARRKMQLNEGLLKPTDIIMPLSVNQEQIDLINTGAINEGYLFENEDEFDALFNIEDTPKKGRPGSGNEKVPLKTLNMLKSKKHSEIPDVYFEELVDMIKLQIQRRIAEPFEKELYGSLDGTRPIFIWGAPAIGKTSIINQMISKEFPSDNLGLYSLTASMLFRDDFMLPASRDNKAVDLPKTWLPCFYKEPCRKEDEVATWAPLNDIANGAKEGREGGIIFVDEFSRVTQEAMTVFMTLVQSREINSQFRLGSKWTFVMAGNRPEDMEGGEHVMAGQTFSWDPAWSGRFIHVNYVPEFEVWLDWAKKKGVERVLLDFITENPKYWFDTLDHSKEDEDSYQEDLSTTGVQILRSDQRAIADADTSIKGMRDAKQIEYARMLMVRRFKQEFMNELKSLTDPKEIEELKSDMFNRIPWKSKNLNWKTIRTEEVLNWMKNEATQEEKDEIENIDLTGDEFVKQVASHMGTTAAKDFEGYMSFFRFFPQSLAVKVWTNPEEVPLGDAMSLMSNIRPMAGAILAAKPGDKNSLNPDEFANLCKFIVRLSEINPTATSVFTNFFFGENNEMIGTYMYGSPEKAASVSKKERNAKMVETYMEGIKILNANPVTKSILKGLTNLMTTNIESNVKENI